MNAMRTEILAGSAATEPSSRPRSLRLEPRQLHTAALTASRGLLLRVRSGSLWVTLEGDATDHWLEAGASLRLEGPGLVVIEAVASPARFELTGG